MAVGESDILCRDTPTAKYTYSRKKKTPNRVGVSSEALPFFEKTHNSSAWKALVQDVQSVADIELENHPPTKVHQKPGSNLSQQTLKEKHQRCTKNVLREKTTCTLPTEIPMPCTSTAKKKPHDCETLHPAKTFPLFQLCRGMKRPSDGSATRSKKRLTSFKETLTNGSALYSRNKSLTVPNKSVHKKVQMVIDLGQKSLGCISCVECGMTYNGGDEDDINLHQRFHTQFFKDIHFPGWKNERVSASNIDLGNDLCGRIVCIQQSDHPSHVRKGEQVRAIVDQKLGFVESNQISSQMVKTYIFVVKKSIVGCLIAESLTTAYPVVPVPSLQYTNKLQEEVSRTCHDYSLVCRSHAAVPARLGISRIWVVEKYRRRGIAKSLITAARNTFMYGSSVPIELIAFSQPTREGKLLAEHYTKTKSFLTYAT
eukprot:CFRG7006T1